MSHTSELNADLPMNIFTFTDYKSTVDLIAGYAANGCQSELNAVSVQLLPLLSPQERMLLRGYYNDGTPPRIAALSMLRRLHIPHQLYA